MNLYIVAKITFLTIAIISATYLSGIGLTRILLKNFDKDMELFFVYWVGIILIGFFLTLFGFLGIGTYYASWFVPPAGIFLLLISKRTCPESANRNQWLRTSLNFLILLILSLFLLSPMIVRRTLTTFSIGNNDPVGYTLISKEIQRNGLIEFIRSYYNDSTFTQKPPSVAYPMVAAELAVNPRWLAAEYLSFFSSLFHIDPVSLFSLLITVTFVLSLPMIWLLSKRTLGLNRLAAGIAFILAAANPHIIYILYHGFFPQIMGTGFFICFLILFPCYIENENATWKDSLLPALMASGVLMSYMDLFPFLLLITILYSLWKLFARENGTKRILMRLSVLFTFILIICPYQACRIFPYFWQLHMKGGVQTGWDVTKGYYLFLFQLGGYFTHPDMNPSRVMEWVANPLIALLIYMGLTQTKNRKYMVCVAVPFVVASAITFSRGYNYAYYKNFTLIFFWLPTAIGAGFSLLSNWIKIKGRFKPLLGLLLAALVIFITAQAFVKTIERIDYSSRNSLFVSQELKTLEDLAKNPKIDDIFITDTLDRWNTLWSIYYLNSKNIGLPHFLGFTSNHHIVGDIREKRFRHALVQEHSGEILSTADSRSLGKKVFESGKFVVYELLEPAGQK